MVLLLRDPNPRREEQFACLSAEDVHSCELPDHGDQARRALSLRRRHVEIDAAMFRCDRLGRGLEVAARLIRTRPRLAREGDVDLNYDGPCAESGDGAGALDRIVDLRADDWIAGHLVRIYRQSRRSREGHQQHRQYGDYSYSPHYGLFSFSSGLAR